MKNSKWIGIMSVVGAALLCLALSIQPISADPTRKYGWEHHTLRAGETISFSVRYQGGEFGDAMAIPDRHGDKNYDDIEMRVLAHFDWGKVLEAKDLKTALVAIRAATGVMGEARQYMELRGELSGELGTPGQAQFDLHQQIMIMALPRCSDTPEQIERATRVGLPIKPPEGR